MSRSRWVVLVAVVIIFAGIGMGTWAYLTSSGTKDPAPALPEAVTWMPSTADLVAFVDLDKLVSSPLREGWEETERQKLVRAKFLSEVDRFREKTGLDPWADFRSLALSARQSEEGNEWGLALSGAPDREKIFSVLEEKEVLEKSVYQDTTLYSFQSDGDKPDSFAFPTPSTAIYGSPAYVRAMLDAGATSAVEPLMAEWIHERAPGDAFRCVISEDALSRFMARQSEGYFRLPPLHSVAVSGRLGAAVSVIVRGKASDPEAARKTAEVIRGLIALGNLNQDASPELRAILDNAQLEVVESNVLLSLALPYSTVRRSIASVLIRE